MLVLESLKQEILDECDEDHVGLWSVVRDVAEFLPNSDEVAIRNQVLDLLQELLNAHEIAAGFPTSDGQGFCPLRLAPEKILDRIRAEWHVGSRPTIGEVMWFTRGEKEAYRVDG